MAEGLLRKALAEAGIPASVGSAGLLRGGSCATDLAIRVTAERGIDITGHRSRTIDPQIVRAAPLVIGMTRQHVREVCVGYGGSIQRTFTLKELVRRGERVGPRAAGETVSGWLARVGAGRQAADLMGDDQDDDVADPAGGPRSGYERTVAELEDLVARLVQLLVGPANVGAPTSGIAGTFGSLGTPAPGAQGTAPAATYAPGVSGDDLRR